MRLLVTGGAGFIGSFLTDALIMHGHDVCILDNLEEQVHHGKKPPYLNREAEFVHGDIRDIAAVKHALDGADAVIHCASAVGVGQSMYEIKRYTDVNVGGTANLLQAIIDRPEKIRKILIPTSMTSYGEGVYLCPVHGAVRPGLRPLKQLEAKDWHLHCPLCAAPVEPVATDESSLRESATVYSLTKNMQEDMVMTIASTYSIPATALRLFNVYGPRQSLSNPYTGVSAIFLSRLKNNEQPVIYEDGLQSRDFVSVHDVVDAFLLALENDAANGQVFNVGSGMPTPIVEIARRLAALTGSTIEPRMTGEFRKNDVRHCFADTTKIRTMLGWSPRVSFDEGMKELIEWGEAEHATDGFAEAQALLKEHGLQS
ncbi:MAG TPA: SDR family NAD(P)-dependent oxidoreductase [Candidatus Peribacteraceae bacterium]|nr:SDR family NAD(P)-dependent oxidoreductase [Candidatus Peribacteraceae bacterium]